jgi:hypothetical protein
MATLDRTRASTLDHQFERVGWALFLIMIGGLWLVPGVPEGTWLIGTGLIMLGVNAARYMNRIRMSGFTIVVGILALTIGVAKFVGSDLPVFPVLLILIGASILWRSACEQESTS